MKNLVIALGLSMLGSMAHAVSVNAGDIAGKTDLIATAQVSVNGTVENILVDPVGLSLYTFKHDSAGVSACSGDCLTEWPPMHVPAGHSVAVPFGTINGNDGASQLTLNGLPLYHYNDDKKAGDAFGQYPQWDVIVIQN